ncbi:MAG: tetratricopeptide repeat-containing sensor histidine kinase [Cyclobacteriaceae bacterium]|nr:tetratricopeptide repeat-containing sensor histidine kinase [Cyclobacteriaceae bacterium]
MCRNIFKYFKLLSLTWILISTAAAELFSQSVNQRRDSLERLLPKARDTSRYSILVQLHYAYRPEYQKALDYATLAYNQAEALGDSVRIVESGRMMAYSLDDLGRNDEVIVMLNRVLAIARRNVGRYPALKPQFKLILNNAGIAYMYKGNYDSALSYHFKSLVLREEEGDKRAIGNSHNNIGLVYFKLRNYQRALDHYLQALSIKDELNDVTDIERILTNIGLCYNQLKMPDAAINSVKRALNSCGNNCSKSVLKEANFVFGISYLDNRNLENATKHLNISLEIAKEQNDQRYWIENLIGLSKVENRSGNYEAGLTYLSEANSLAQGSGFAELLLDIYKESFKNYRQINDFRNEALFQTRYIDLKDSVYGENLLKNLATIQTNYEQRENLKTIRLINENIRLKDEQIQRQRIQYVFVVLVTILVASLAGVLVWANRRQQRHNTALSEAKSIIEQQNKELTKTNEELDKRVREKTIDLVNTNTMLQDVNEELDNYIYRTAHDIRGPLVTLKGVCNVAQMDVKDVLALDYLRRLDLTAERLNLILTRLLIVSQINHAMLSVRQVDFNSIMQEVLEKFKELPARMKIEYRVAEGVVLRSDPDLVSIVLENLIGNAIKFYNTSDRIEPFVKVEIGNYDADHVIISVEDNGIGISQKDRNEVFHLFVRASERSETGGIGLYLTKLSAHKLGGEIFLMDTSDKGSKFLVLFPIDLQPILDKREEEERERMREKEIRDKASTESGGADALERYYSSRRRSK